MNTKTTLLGSIGATLLLTAASTMTRKGAERSYTAVTGKEPPSHVNDRNNVDMKEAFLWAALVGAGTGLMRVAIRHYFLDKDDGSLTPSLDGD